MESFSALYKNGLDGWGFSFRRSQLFRYEKYMEMINRNKNMLSPSGKVLEVGCGQGFFSFEYLYTYFKNILGVDISEQAIQEARMRYPQITFFVDCLPGLQESSTRGLFHLITLHECLYYLPDEARKKAIARAWELCENDGYLMISVNIGDKPYLTKEETLGLLGDHFVLVDSDDMCIKQYYRYIESNVWKLLEIVQPDFWSKTHKYNTFSKKLAHLLFGNMIACSIYNHAISFLCKSLLYYMPIKYIDWLERNLHYDKGVSVYIILCKKKRSS